MVAANVGMTTVWSHNVVEWRHPINRTTHQGVPRLAIPHMLLWRYIRMANPSSLSDLIAAWHQLNASAALPTNRTETQGGLHQDPHFNALMGMVVAWEASRQTVTP